MHSIISILISRQWNWLRQKNSYIILLEILSIKNFYKTCVWLLQKLKNLLLYYKMRPTHANFLIFDESKRRPNHLLETANKQNEFDLRPLTSTSSKFRTPHWKGTSKLWWWNLSRILQWFFKNESKILTTQVYEPSRSEFQYK